MVKKIVLAYMNHLKMKFGQTIRGFVSLPNRGSLKYLEEKGAEPTSQKTIIY